MTIDATCKFCKTILHLDIDDCYAELSDPLRLFNLACCDRCAGLMERRRDIKTKVQRIATSLLWMRASGITNEQTEKMRAICGNLLRKWLALAAEFRRSMTEADFDPAMVEQIMDSPDRVNQVLSRIWVMQPERMLIPNSDT